MKKIQSLFKKDYDKTPQAFNEIVEGSEWVVDGEGEATIKYDGTACMIQDGILYKRFDVKQGREIPISGIPCEKLPDEKTGHWPWWIKVYSGPEDRYFREGFFEDNPWEDGTYELVGPKIGGNKDHYTCHILIKHGDIILTDFPRTFDKIRIYLETHEFEGVVWHHPDGRMVKVKRKDFGLKW